MSRPQHPGFHPGLIILVFGTEHHARQQLEAMLRSAPGQAHAKAAGADSRRAVASAPEAAARR